MRHWSVGYLCIPMVEKSDRRDHDWRVECSVLASLYDVCHTVLFRPRQDLVDDDLERPRLRQLESQLRDLKEELQSYENDLFNVMAEQQDMFKRVAVGKRVADVCHDLIKCHEDPESHSQLPFANVDSKENMD